MYMYCGAVCVTFLSRQESNQRMRHRGGAEAGCSRTRAALPYVPHPARTWYPLEYLNGQNLLSGYGLTVSGLFHDVRSPDIHRTYSSSKKSEHFLLEQDLG